MQAVDDCSVAARASSPRRARQDSSARSRWHSGHRVFFLVLANLCAVHLHTRGHVGAISARTSGPWVMQSGDATSLYLWTYGWDLPACAERLLSWQEASNSRGALRQLRSSNSAFAFSAQNWGPANTATLRALAAFHSCYSRIRSEEYASIIQPRPLFEVNDIPVSIGIFPYPYRM
jgi:hypothetical protein